MTTEQLILKDKSKTQKDVYLGNQHIAIINDHLETNIFFLLKRNSFVQAEINKSKYIIKCTYSGSYHCMSSVFEIYSPNAKKIGTFDVSLFFLFFPITSRTRLNRNDGIHYLEYDRSINFPSFQILSWHDENQRKVAILKGNTFEFDGVVLRDQIELYVIAVITGVIEKNIIKKMKKLAILRLVMVIIIIFLFGLIVSYLK